MRRILLSLSLVITLAGVARAQEITGSKADAAKSDILKLYDQKLTALLEGGAVAADYFDRNDGADLTQINADASMSTKTQVVNGLRSGAAPKLLTMKQDEHRVRVYLDGNMAIVTVRGIGSHEHNGKVSNIRNQFLDVWIKDGGKWQRVAHSVTPIPGQ